MLEIKSAAQSYRLLLDSRSAAQSYRSLLDFRTPEQMLRLQPRLRPRLRPRLQLWAGTHRLVETEHHRAIARCTGKDSAQQSSGSVLHRKNKYSGTNRSAFCKVKQSQALPIEDCTENKSGSDSRSVSHHRIKTTAQTDGDADR